MIVCGIATIYYKIQEYLDAKTQSEATSVANEKKEASKVKLDANKGTQKDIPN